MHIAFVCNEYPPSPHGGVGSLTQTLARALVGAGHRATVIGNYTLADGDHHFEDDAGVRVIRLATPRRGGLLRPLIEQRRLWRHLRAEHGVHPIDIVEGPEPSFWAAPRHLPYPLLVRMNGGHRYFADAEGRPIVARRAWIERRSLRRADALVAVSEHTAVRTRALVGLGDRPIEVIPNPVDLEVFRATRKPIPGTVLFFGTLCEKKGVRQLVTAFPAVAAAIPGSRLLIAGPDQVDPATGVSFRSSLEALVPTDIMDRVDFLGPVDHGSVPDLISSAEVCALPSHIEALPVAWLEVLASGRPLVASRTGPGPEVTVDGESALLVDPFDPDQIAAALIEVLADPALGIDLATAGRKLAIERFSIRGLLEVNLRHYQELLQPSNPSAKLSAQGPDATQSGL